MNGPNWKTGTSHAPEYESVPLQTNLKIFFLLNSSKMFVMAIPILIFLPSEIFRASLKLNIMPQKRRLPHNKKAPLSEVQKNIWSFQILFWISALWRLETPACPARPVCDQYISIAPSAVVGRLLWLQPDGPRVGRDDVTAPMDAAGVRAFVEFVGHEPQVPFFNYNIARNGCQQLLAVLIPADERWNKAAEIHWTETTLHKWCIYNCYIKTMNAST